MLPVPDLYGPLCRPDALGGADALFQARLFHPLDHPFPDGSRFGFGPSFTAGARTSKPPAITQVGMARPPTDRPSMAGRASESAPADEPGACPHRRPIMLNAHSQGEGEHQEAAADRPGARRLVIEGPAAGRETDVRIDDHPDPDRGEEQAAGAGLPGLEHAARVVHVELHQGMRTAYEPSP